MAEIHDMTTDGQGSTSRYDTAGGQDSAKSASRNFAQRRQQEISTSPAVSHNDMMQSHYEERAVASESAWEAARADAEPPREISADELADRLIARKFTPWK